jgi:uncharacterized protein involved in response to NO
MPSAPHAHAPQWRREPHRLLFPLGAVLGVVAVLPFACGGGGGGGASLALFHSVAQIQGFLTCFVVGFLLTLIPRHTRTAPAATWEVSSAVVLPAVAVLSAWVGDPGLASWLWLVLLVMVMAFTVSRLRARPSTVQLVPVLMWVPISLAAGGAGAVLVAFGPGLPMAHALEAWTVGRGLLVQGFVSGLVLGIGGFLLPQVTRGEPPPLPAADSARRRRSFALHAVAAVAFFGSFPLELVSGPQVGFGLRAAVAAAVLIGSARIHRRPTLPGLHRRLIWLASWLVPIAFLFGALAPRFRGAALHVLFVGGFAQLTLAVSTHVVLWREDGQRVPAPAPASDSRWSAVGIRLMAALLAAAFAARIAATLHLRHVADWLGIAAYAFCAAVAAWAAVVAPALLAGRSAGARQPARRGR